MRQREYVSVTGFVLPFSENPSGATTESSFRYAANFAGVSSSVAGFDS